jgi:hypothetical protein
MYQGENGLAFSRTALISAENLNYSSRLDARDQLKQAFRDVRLMGLMGSHPSSPTNLGGVEGLTGAARMRSRSVAGGPDSAGSCECPVFGDDDGLFCRDHSSALGTGFSPPKVLSGGFSGETSGAC